MTGFDPLRCQNFDGRRSFKQRRDRLIIVAIGLRLEESVGGLDTAVDLESDDPVGIASKRINVDSVSEFPAIAACMCFCQIFCASSRAPGSVRC